MRKAFKTQVEINGGRLAVLFFYQVNSFRQPPLLQPLAGGGIKCFFEIALKGSQASAGEPGKLFDRYIEMKIAEHKLFQVDLIRLRKVEQECAQRGHGMQ